MTSFYATLRTRSRGALPLLSADSFPTLRGARGQAPCTPKIALFRLPSSVTLFLGRSGPRNSVPGGGGGSSNELLSAVLTRPTLCICKGFATFLDVNRPTRRATIWRGLRGARGAGVVLGL